MKTWQNYQLKRDERYRLQKPSKTSKVLQNLNMTEYILGKLLRPLAILLNQAVKSNLN